MKPFHSFRIPWKIICFPLFMSVFLSSLEWSITVNLVQLKSIEIWPSVHRSVGPLVPLMLLMRKRTKKVSFRSTLQWILALRLFLFFTIEAALTFFFRFMLDNIYPISAENIHERVMIKENVSILQSQWKFFGTASNLSSAMREVLK